MMRVDPENFDHGDIDRLLAFVDFIKDASNIRKAIAGFKASRDEAQAKLDEARAAIEKAAADQAAANRTLAKAEAETNAAAAMLRDGEALEDKNSATSEALLERDQKFAARTRFVEIREAEVGKLKTDLERREAVMAKREQDADALMAKANALIEEHHARLEELTHIVTRKAAR